MTNQELKEKYHSETGFRWYDNVAHYANWLEDALSEVLEKDGWISVEDRLPEHEKNVFAVLDGKVCVMNYFSFKESGEKSMAWGYLYDGINGDGIYDDNYYPTHWMPLPNPPKTK